MKENQTREILKFYDENTEFKPNERYSDASQTVYTKPDDKYHWLVAKPIGENSLEIHQTDEQGMIIARDTYDGSRNSFKCVDMERLQADGKHRIHFDDDEVNLLYQFGEGGRDGTLAMLKEIQPQIKDPVLMEIVKRTADKVATLTPEVCSTLISCVKSRKLYERDHSIRERLARAKAQSKQTITNEPKSRENSRTRKGEQSL